MEKTHVNSERELGADPKDGKMIYVRLGKFGPLAQKGASDDPHKQFASLRKDQSIETITLEEAVKLFELPRVVGTHDGKEVTSAIGRFGAYIKYDGKFYSLAKGQDPYTINLEEALELVKAKEELEWYQRKLKEAQERNRKLDWCLTRTTEELLK
jgi:DNA topoisomerase-1